jgi:pimeloyl-ACP methyl ester carboxylesterase
MSLRRLAAVTAALTVISAAVTGSAARADGPLGIIFLHGKLAATENAEGPVQQLTNRLKAAGYLVATPEMCWSKRRSYDRPYPECLSEIDAVVSDLKAKGASAIVVGGLSAGGNAAIAYAASHPDVLGVMALSPADDPGVKIARPTGFAGSVAKAKTMLADGRADEKTRFEDTNTGPNGSYDVTYETTPRIFLSFYSPDSPTNIPATIAKLRAPLLWAAGDRDPTQRSGPGYAFDKAPAGPLTRYVVLHANHIEVPGAAAETVMGWLRELPVH